MGDDPLISRITGFVLDLTIMSGLALVVIILCVLLSISHAASQTSRAWRHPRMPPLVSGAPGAGRRGAIFIGGEHQDDAALLPQLLDLILCYILD